MISRKLATQIRNRLFKGKIIIIAGARQVGKSTLLREVVSDLDEPLWLNGDEADVRQALTDTTSAALKSFFGGRKLVIIAEAQRIENIGLTLKLAADNFQQTQIIATGSSSFDLANKVNEPLTGRKYEYFLYPLSFSEMAGHTSLLEEKRLIEHRLIYGYYPEIVNTPGHERELLSLITSSYLYRDIFNWRQIKKPALLENLLQALALQIGNEVSYLELAQLTGSDNETVERYVDLLEKSYVIFRLGSLSRNLRNELKRSRKIYFWDVGVRNAIIKNFNPLSLRQDAGALWENFLIVERIKYNAYQNQEANRWFWRTHAQQEIDYVEERNGTIGAYEIKWKKSGKAKIPKTFLEHYPTSKGHVITTDNFTEFIFPSE